MPMNVESERGFTGKNIWYDIETKVMQYPDICTSARARVRVCVYECVCRTSHISHLYRAISPLNGVLLYKYRIDQYFGNYMNRLSSELDHFGSDP